MESTRADKTRAMLRHAAQRGCAVPTIAGAERYAWLRGAVTAAAAAGAPEL